MVSGMQHHLVEWFRADADRSRIAQITAALAASQSGSEVAVVLILAVPTDQVVYGLFAAASPEALMELCNRAGVPPQRVSPDVLPALHRAVS